MGKKSIHNRREFLKKFSLLSSTPLIFFGVRCVYGPPSEFDEPARVREIYYQHPYFGLFPVNRKREIPVDISFEIEFTYPMDTATENIVNFKDSKGEGIELNLKWKNGNNLVVTPEKSLNFAAGYTISISSDAKDIHGDNIIINESAAAEFNTTHVNLQPKSIIIRPGEESVIKVVSVYKDEGIQASENEWKIINWSIGDNSIASIDATGKVTGAGTGTTFLIVVISLNNTAYTGAALVTVES